MYINVPPSSLSAKKVAACGLCAIAQYTLGVSDYNTVHVVLVVHIIYFTFYTVAY